MSQSGPDGPPPPRADPDELVQMNVRVPRRLRDQIDSRRGPLSMSRDKWVANALRWALRQPPVPAARRTPR